MAETHMTWSTPSVPNHPATADALRQLDAAYARTNAAKRAHDHTSTADADRGLRVAVDAARDAGIAWGAIADRIGIARGNAYQRYRKRSA